MVWGHVSIQGLPPSLLLLFHIGVGENRPIFGIHVRQQLREEETLGHPFVSRNRRDASDERIVGSGNSHLRWLYI
jgi:hypothetical protein